jgi:hypothetical protein
MAGAANDRPLGRARSGGETGTTAEMHYAFADTMRMLSNRINIFVSLPMKSLDALSLQKQLDAIGKTRDTVPILQRAPDERKDSD